MPDAGHLLHMPSHIYQRVGRYADAIKSNQLAMAADRIYLAHRHAPGMYPIMYTPHNIHFLWSAATADGQSRLAIDSARKVAAAIDDTALAAVPASATFRVVPYWAYARFGKWNEILQESAPPATNAFLKGGWHYACGLAFVATRQLEQAERELNALRQVVKDGSLDWTLMSQNTAYAVLSIGPNARGRNRQCAGTIDSAIGHLDRAVRLEDDLVYQSRRNGNLPPGWHSGPSFLKPDAQPKRRRSIGKICGGIATMGGLYSVCYRLCVNKRRALRRNWLSSVLKGPGRVRTLISTPRALVVLQRQCQAAQQAQRPNDRAPEWRRSIQNGNL